MSNTHTKGNVIVEDIKIWDIHFKYDYGIGIQSKVITLPVQDEDGAWEWKSENTRSQKIIDYLVNPKYPHYAANLYDYEAYKVTTWI